MYIHNIYIHNIIYIIYICIYIYIHTDCSSRVLLFVRSKMNPPGRRCLCGFRPPLRQGLRRAKRWARPRGFHAPHVKSGPAQWDLVPHLRLLETKDLVAVKNVSHKKSPFAYLTVMLLNWSYQPDHSLNILSITSPILSPLMVKSLRLLKPLISSLRSSSQSSLQHADHHMLLSG